MSATHERPWPNIKQNTVKPLVFQNGHDIYFIDLYFNHCACTFINTYGFLIIELIAKYTLEGIVHSQSQNPCWQTLSNMEI